jgi:hypothetical protein
MHENRNHATNCWARIVWNVNWALVALDSNPFGSESGRDMNPPHVEMSPANHFFLFAVV